MIQFSIIRRHINKTLTSSYSLSWYALVEFKPSMILWLKSPHLVLVRGYLVCSFLGGCHFYISLLPWGRTQHKWVAVSVRAWNAKSTASWATLALNLRVATSPLAITFADSRVLRPSPRIFSIKRETANRVIVRECSTVSLNGKAFGELTYKFGLFFVFSINGYFDVCKINNKN